MTTDHLKAIFLQAHKEDRRRAFINYVIRSLGILLVFSAILFLVLALRANQADEYLIYLVIAAMVGTVLYPFYCSLKLWNSCTKEIDRLINCLKSGALAHTIKEYKTHRISIPLGKKTVNWLPVDCLCIIMNNDNRPFHLPVSKSHVQEIKKILTKNTPNSLEIGN
ncbi:hypothetical protein FACS189421_07410 [Bacteroidia bacterium]|nr:hypothetical protein FACS189421_07410 [Bacteroidia bacterium]GHT02781.1 hypothetical protein FACS189423_02210 [Bacteroidia bacterium]GHT45670.1 hypothetical protein FACS189440_02100 [Bacteroidia bacterium]